MKRSTATVVAAVGTLLMASGAVRAERFEGIKYLGGAKGYGSRDGSVVVENGSLRFEDPQGREVFNRSLVSASAWVGSEKRTRFGKVLRNIALLPVTMPLCSAGGNPWVGGDRKDSPIVVVRVGVPAEMLRLRVPFARLQQIVDALNREAAPAAAAP
ncbi:MAG: hypothetical protein U0599_01430 [Vicinamibacteria bacterium]